MDRIDSARPGPAWQHKAMKSDYHARYYYLLNESELLMTSLTISVIIINIVVVVVSLVVDVSEVL